MSGISGGEPKSLAGEGVEMGCSLVLPPLTAQIVDSEIIGENQHDVRLVLSRLVGEQLAFQAEGAEHEQDDRRHK